MYIRNVLVAVVILLVSACNKTDDPVPITPAKVSTMSAKIGSTSFTAQDISGSENAQELSLLGKKNPGTGKESSISLQIKHLNGLIVYSIVDTSNIAIYTENGTTYHATSGSVTLTTDNEVHVAGHFEFEAESPGSDVRSISEGSFDVYK